MVKRVTYKGAADAYLVTYRRDTSEITADYQACFLIRKNETIAMDDRDFKLLKDEYFHIAPEKLIEVE